MSELKNIQRYFRRSQYVLRGIMFVLIALFAREFFEGFMDGLREATQDGVTGAHDSSNHGFLSMGAMDISLLLFTFITWSMISILKEFESGLFFTETVLRKTFKIGLYTEITCYLLLPLAALLHAAALNGVAAYASTYFENINYIGGVAGTFIRHLSKLFMIGKDLEETHALTV